MLLIEVVVVDLSVGRSRQPRAIKMIAVYTSASPADGRVATR